VPDILSAAFGLKQLIDMNFYTIELFASSIFLAGVIALFRFKEIRKEYYPFIILVWIGCVNEIISFLLVINGYYNVVNGIIYDLCESILLLWFFHTLGVFQRKQFWPWLLGPIFLIIWVVESFFSQKTGRFNSFFIMVYSFIVVILSINALNQMLFRERNLLRNPAFLICIGFVIFFTYKLLTEVFWYYGLSRSWYFTQQVFNIFSIVNMLCNFIFALAILWMKQKKAFTLQF